MVAAFVSVCVAFCEAVCVGVCNVFLSQAAHAVRHWTLLGWPHVVVPGGSLQQPHQGSCSRPSTEGGREASHVCQCEGTHGIQLDMEFAHWPHIIWLDPHEAAIRRLTYHTGNT